MRRILATFGMAVLALVFLASSASAGPEKVLFPADYQTKFVVYLEVERPDRNPNQIRLMYANPEAVTAARSGQPAPHGTVLVMEDRIAELGADGKPRRDAMGRMIPSDRVANVFVMEKQPGWGAEYPDAKRNGEWEYASFDNAGTVRPGSTDGCFACHQSRKGRDWTFTFQKWVLDGKPAR